MGVVPPTGAALVGSTEMRKKVTIRQTQNGVQKLGRIAFSPFDFQVRL
jgi:hypothetical protein